MESGAGLQEEQSCSMCCRVSGAPATPPCPEQCLSLGPPLHRCPLCWRKGPAGGPPSKKPSRMEEPDQSAGPGIEDKLTELQQGDQSQGENQGDCTRIQEKMPENTDQRQGQSAAESGLEEKHSDHWDQDQSRGDKQSSSPGFKEQPATLEERDLSQKQRPCLGYEEEAAVLEARGQSWGQSPSPQGAILRERDQNQAQGQSSRGESEGSVCNRHGLPLTHVCLQDEQLVCADCVSDTHLGHRCCHANQVARQRKEALKSTQRMLKVKLGAFKAARDGCEQMGRSIRSQSRDAGGRIRAEFERLHELLRQDMAARLDSLEQEEERKLKWVESRAQKLDMEISALLGALRSTEQAIANQDIPFLQNYRATKKRAQYKVQNPGRAVCEIDVAKHLGNLRFKIMKSMMGTVTYTPVVLSPSTAHRALCVSEDLSSVRWVELQRTPQSGLQERPGPLACVLGSESLDRGRHSWEVEVGGVASWGVGVVRESVWRDRGRAWSLALEQGAFLLSCRDGTLSSTPSAQLPEASGPLQRVRVLLDFQSGQVTFTNPTDEQVLVAFPLTERVLPVFSLHPDASSAPLRISATKVAMCQLTP